MQTVYQIPPHPTTRQSLARPPTPPSRAISPRAISPPRERPRLSRPYGKPPSWRHARPASAASNSRIFYAKSREKAEVLIGRDHDKAMFNGQCREVGIRHELMVHFGQIQERVEIMPMPNGRHGRPNTRHRQPRTNLPPRLGNRDCRLHDSRIGRQPHKSHDTFPRDSQWRICVV